jgi:hypothetical protein
MLRDPAADDSGAMCGSRASLVTTLRLLKEASDVTVVVTCGNVQVNVVNDFYPQPLTILRVMLTDGVVNITHHPTGMVHVPVHADTMAPALGAVAPDGGVAGAAYGFAHSDTSDCLRVELGARATVDYHNSRLMAWEPVVETFAVSASIARAHRIGHEVLAPPRHIFWAVGGSSVSATDSHARTDIDTDKDTLLADVVAWATVSALFWTSTYAASSSLQELVAAGGGPPQPFIVDVRLPAIVNLNLTTSLLDMALSVVVAVDSNSSSGGSSSSRAAVGTGTGTAVGASDGGHTAQQQSSAPVSLYNKSGVDIVCWSPPSSTSSR